MNEHENTARVKLAFVDEAIYLAQENKNLKSLIAQIHSVLSDNPNDGDAQNSAVCLINDWYEMSFKKKE